MGPADGPLGIGAVLRALREEFPEVTASKIRFLEAEGLVEPGRSPSGHRRFSPGDVERLGGVLRMQRDGYLPLRVIKEYLDAAGPGALPDPPARPSLASSSTDRIELAELLASAEATEAELAEAESQGLLAPYPDGSYDAGAPAVLRAVSGFGRHGIQPQRLRAAKAAAERQAAMLKQAVASPGSTDEAGEDAEGREGATARLAALSVRLYAEFLQAALRVPPSERHGVDSREGE